MTTQVRTGPCCCSIFLLGGGASTDLPPQTPLAKDGWKRSAKEQLLELFTANTTLGCPQPCPPTHPPNTPPPPSKPTNQLTTGQPTPRPTPLNQLTSSTCQPPAKTPRMALCDPPKHLRIPRNFAQTSPKGASSEFSSRVGSCCQEFLGKGFFFPPQESLPGVGENPPPPENPQKTRRSFELAPK